MILQKNNWPKTNNAINYRIFASLVHELVHDASWDSYKCHTLSTTAKLRETIITSHKVSIRTIAKPSLTPILEEVNDALISDPVVDSILTTKKLLDLKFQLKILDPVEKTLGLAELLLDLLEKDYQSTCEQQIIEMCVAGGSKFKLQTLTKLYVSHLVNCGFSSAYIYSCATGLFFNSDIKRCDKHLLNNFFKCFVLGDEKKYRVFVTGKTSFIKSLANLFGLKTYFEQSKIPNQPIKNFPKYIGKGKKKSISIFEDVPASDPFSAAKKIEHLVGLTKSFQYLHPTQAAIKADNRMIAVEQTKNIATIVNIGSSFQPHKYLRSRLGDHKSVERLASYVFQRNSPTSFQRRERIMRSLNSVALASNSSDPESRLVTIWSAFEALLPEPSKEEGKGVRITHFVPLIVPCSCYDYVWANFNECFENCVQEFGKEFEEKVEELSKNKGAIGLAKIMIGEKNNKKEILKIIDSSPLMLNRFSKLHNLIGTPSKLIKYWEVHEQRVRWQLHRIYRERNDIVHKGAKSPFLEGLAENSYVYYRSVFVGLETVYKRFDVADPTTALELVSGLYESKKREVEKLNSDADLSKTEKQTKILEVIFKNRLC